MFLAGVFMGVEQPTGIAPPRLEFDENSSSAESFTPLLHQVFFVGDGLTADGIAQSFEVPAGAAWLFLGFADSAGFMGDPGFYGDNIGSLDAAVEFVPGTEPDAGFSDAEPMREDGSISRDAGPVDGVVRQLPSDDRCSCRHVVLDPHPPTSILIVGLLVLVRFTTRKRTQQV